MLARKSSMHRSWCESQSLQVDVKATYGQAIKTTDTQIPKVPKAEVSVLSGVSDLFYNCGWAIKTPTPHSGRTDTSGITTFTSLIKSQRKYLLLVRKHVP